MESKTIITPQTSQQTFILTSSSSFSLISVSIIKIYINSKYVVSTYIYQFTSISFYHFLSNGKLDKKFPFSQNMIESQCDHQGLHCVISIYAQDAAVLIGAIFAEAEENHFAIDYCKIVYAFASSL